MTNDPELRVGPPVGTVERPRRGRRRWIALLATAAILVVAAATAIAYRVNSRDGRPAAGLPNPTSVTPYPITTVTVGTFPTDVAVDPTTHAVYVTNMGDGTVSVIEPTNTL